MALNTEKENYSKPDNSNTKNQEAFQKSVDAVIVEEASPESPIEVKPEIKDDKKKTPAKVVQKDLGLI